MKKVTMLVIMPPPFGPLCLTVVVDLRVEVEAAVVGLTDVVVRGGVVAMEVVVLAEGIVEVDVDRSVEVVEFTLVMHVPEHMHPQVTELGTAVGG